MTPADRRPAETPEAEQALLWLRRSGAESELAIAVGRRVRRRRRQRLAWAGAACLAALAAGGFAWRTPPSAAAETVAVAALPAPEVKSAILSGPRREVLPDGSVVEFKDGAAIEHRFSAETRWVTLLRGEAHFQVAKNPERPFIVSAHGVAVRAVGTAFSVQMESGAVEVVVTEGRVAVDALPAASVPARSAPVAAEPSAQLGAGDRARIRVGETAPAVDTLPEPELARRFAWRVPQLEFSRTPLGEIVKLVNRHAAPRGRPAIVIAASSPELHDVKLSGFLAADNTDGLVRLLETNFQVRAEATADTVVLHGPAR
jgi:transmembrane sensor